MDSLVFTHALWRVKDGMEEECIEAWSELGRVFSRLPNPPVGTGTLIRSTADPHEFFSFGPWESETTSGPCGRCGGAGGPGARSLMLFRSEPRALPAGTRGAGDRVKAERTAEDLGHRAVFLYETDEGGHGASYSAEELAMTMAFFLHFLHPDHVRR